MFNSLLRLVNSICFWYYSIRIQFVLKNCHSHTPTFQETSCDVHFVSYLMCVVLNRINFKFAFMNEVLSNEGVLVFRLFCLLGVFRWI